MLILSAVFLTLRIVVLANPIPQDSSDIIIADTDLYDVSGIGCTPDQFTSETSETSETSDEIIQKRQLIGRANACPVLDQPRIIPKPTTNQDKTPSSSTRTQHNPCPEYRPVHLTCGGPVVPQNDWNFVLNCVHGM